MNAAGVVGVGHGDGTCGLWCASNVSDGQG